MIQKTEMAPDLADCIDTMQPVDALSTLLAGQMAAVSAIQSALPDISTASILIEQTVRDGGVINYVAAGSSGLMALADGSELSGTFGINKSQIRIHMAGGIPVDGNMPGDTEDDISRAGEIVSSLKPGDLVIAISASGTTPYPCEIARLARQAGVKVVAVANNAGSTLLGLADVAIFLPTPPEVLAGSTRLGAGTAQKIALNLMSTLAAVRLGHVYQGLMVNLQADNIKLRKRATGIVSSISGLPSADAVSALNAASGDVKLAILISAGCDSGLALQLLKKHKGHLGPCLDAASTPLKPQTKPLQIN